MALTYDETSGKILLFGGFDGSTYLNDTWTFDGTNWSNVDVTNPPPSRSAAQMAYDRNTHQVVLFGGFDGQQDLSDTWLWDGTTLSWSEATPVHSPGHLTGPLVFTGPQGSVMEFGGYDGNLYHLDTWLWTGIDWKKLHPPSSPFARAFTTVATDLHHKYVLLFGGLGDVNPVNTWASDGGSWIEQTQATQPPWVYSSSSAFDPALRSIILFGGGSGGVDQNTTWGWTGENWIQLFPAQSPEAREGAGMAYVPSLGALVLFGGQDSGVPLGDTWKFSQ